MKNNHLFDHINVKQLISNPFKMIGDDWFLITAGTPQKFNTMTAAWGHLGVLWKKNTVTIFVRPTRFTNQFLQNNQEFSLCFFSEKYRKVLNYCGSFSGRDVDKIKETHLTPVFTESNTIYFAEAETVIICKKIYSDILKPGLFEDENIDKHYPMKDYHHLYIGEIIDCLTKKITE